MKTLLSSPTFVEVLLPKNVKETFTYQVSAQEIAKVKVGHRVVIPLRGRLAVGIIWQVHQQRPAYRVKMVVAIPDSSPLLSAGQCAFIRWLGEYYLIDLGRLAQMATRAVSSLFRPVIRFVGSKSVGTDSVAGILLGEVERQEALTWEAVKKQVGKGAVQLVERLYKAREITLVTPLVHRVPAQNHIKLAKDICPTDLATEKQRLALRCYQAIIEEERPVGGWVPITALIAHGLSRAVILRLVEKGVFYQTKRAKKKEPLICPPSFISSLAQRSFYEEIVEKWRKKAVLLACGQGSNELLADGLVAFFRPLADGQAICLLPDRFTYQAWREKLKGEAGVVFYDSRLGSSRKHAIWQGVAEGRIRRVVGMMDVLLLPFDKIRRMVVVEEGSGGYLPDRLTLPFHGRDSAVMLASQHGARVLLIATAPSVGSFYNVKVGKYALLERQGSQRPYSALRLMTNREWTVTRPHPLATPLRKRIEAACGSGRPVVILHHRKGYATYHFCPDCQWIASCPTCHRNLIYYQNGLQLHCRYCSYQVDLYQSCPACSSPKLRQGGMGIEQWVELLQFYFRKQSVILLNGESTKDEQAILTSFKQGEADILVATPHLIPWLAQQGDYLVIVPDIDRWLRIPSFQAEEVCYQWLGQLAGKLGGHHEVWLQSNEQERGKLHRLVGDVLEQRWRDFCERNLVERKTYRYPPYQRIIKIILQSPYSLKLATAAKKLASFLQRELAIDTWGPQPLPALFPTPSYTVFLWCKLPQERKMKEKLFSLVSRWKRRSPSQVEVTFEVDGIV